MLGFLLSALKDIGGAAKDGVLNNIRGGQQPQPVPSHTQAPMPGPVASHDNTNLLAPMQPYAPDASLMNAQPKLMAPKLLSSPTDPIGPMPMPQLQKRPLAPAQVPQDRKPMFGGLDQIY